MSEAQSVIATPLEIVLLELLLNNADVLSTDFERLVLMALEKVGGGELLFNLRLDDDPAYQRGAALALAAAEEEVLAMCFLDLAGRTITVECARSSLHPLARRASAIYGGRDKSPFSAETK